MPPRSRPFAGAGAPDLWGGLVAARKGEGRWRYFRRKAHPVLGGRHCARAAIPRGFLKGKARQGISLTGFTDLLGGPPPTEYAF